MKAIQVSNPGARYLDMNLNLLKTDGCLLLIGLMGGRRAAINLATVLSKRLKIVGSTLRNLSPNRKNILVKNFLGAFARALSQGDIRPVIVSTIPLEIAGTAHQRISCSKHFGKIILDVLRSHQPTEESP